MIFNLAEKIDLGLEFGCGHPLTGYGYPNKIKMDLVIKSKYN
jgi:hypothetical protein